LNPSPREEISEIARGLRRQLEALGESGFIGLGARDVSKRVERSDSAASTIDRNANSETSNLPQKPATIANLQFDSATDDPTRRTSVSERGSIERTAHESAAALAIVDERVRGCTLCGLCKGRLNAVPGEGNPKSRVMFVGEGPGATEDEMGRPFVGRAGQLLTKIIESGMGISRNDVYIANIVKCRPPENRDPLPEEVAACVPYLLKQIEIIDPEVIIPLGRHSMRELAGVSERETIGRVRGAVYRVRGRAIIPTYHPAYLLRNPPEKVKVWHDIQLAMKELGLPIPKNNQ
jgi:DNA polymerase